jgi:tRNA pseudouridine32 synthase/23S rRNA pseudouridine746 synthase
MLVALNAHSAQQLNKQFQARTIEKRYVALLEGWLAEDSGQITAAIAKDKTCFPRVKICATSGKAASTEYHVVQRLEQPPRSLVAFTPLTGRTHQLRIHSQAIGHPILGCDLYSSATSQQMATRLLLHASEVFFAHPRSGEAIHWHCPFVVSGVSLIDESVNNGT